MSKTESTMLALGTIAPKFMLPDVSSNNSYGIGGKSSYQASVLMFICNHCPYVQYINKALVQLAAYYIPKNILFLAISSNDVVHYPADSPELMKKAAQENEYPFPYLYDESQEVAKAYKAACTPDFYIFNKDLQLAYRGQFDDSRPGNNVPITGNSIRQALDDLLNNKEPAKEQKPSLGCNIKWKKEVIN